MPGLCSQADPLRGVLCYSKYGKRSTYCLQTIMQRAWSASHDSGRDVFTSVHGFGPELKIHQQAQNGSSAGFYGPVGVPWLVFDLDRPEGPVEALRDAARLARLMQRDLWASCPPTSILTMP